ncbi:hypothetical protein JCM3774_001705 [Rhodotorula dairenensis]
MRFLLSKAWNAVHSPIREHGAGLPTYDSLPGEPHSDEKQRSAYLSASSPFSTRSSSRSSGSHGSDADGSTCVRAGKGWARLGAAACGGLVAGIVLARSTAHDPIAFDGPTRTDVWKQYDIRETSLVGTKPIKKLPACERTVVLEWESWQYGFGSTTVSTLQAMVFAKRYNYEVLFSRSANPYGSYLEEARDASEEAPHPDNTPRLRAWSGDTHPLNRFIRDTTFTSEDLETLPKLDSTRPKPGRDNVPDLFRQRFLQYSALTARHFQLNARIRARRDSLRFELGLLDNADRPTIGMHFRGGDKLKHECRPSAQMSCGNITLHCETALDALRSFAPEYPQFHLETNKARLVLMTAEPDALEKIASEPICHQHFEIVPFPRGGTDKPYKQADFYELSEATRLDDTQRFLAEADVLANYVDATVVSANSNTGRLIFTRGGPTRAIDEYRIRSIDVPWHPMQFAPFAGYCDGTTGHCFPE